MHLKQRNIVIILCIALITAATAPPTPASNSSSNGTAFELHPNWPNDTMAECGVSASDRIVGGRNATLGQYPWLARIGILTNGKIVYKCGGSLISKRHVLTAAHCVTRLGNSNDRAAKVTLGENNVQTENDCDDDSCADPPQLINIDDVAFHPDYYKPPYANDVAVIRLSRPARITEWVLPICLPFAEQLNLPLVNKWAEVAGWGNMRFLDNEEPGPLQTLQVEIVAINLCINTFNSYIEVGNNGRQLCIGGKAGKDSCSGDSGGPLVMAAASRALHEPRYYQFGIVSVGDTYCGMSGTPSVYTSVPFYLDWILNQMN